MTVPDRVPAATLERFARDVLGAAGWRPDDVQLIAEALVESSLRGIDSHGVVALLPTYARAAAAAADRPEPFVAKDEGAVAVVDGGGGLGLRGARLCVELALARSVRWGIGATAARNLGYLGALWWSVEPAARGDAVSLAMCTSQACVAPHGGLEPLHGTNPIAVAVPSDPDPIVFDTRTNALRMADYWESVRTGRPLPDASLIDSAGLPVTTLDRFDDAVYLPLAGARGYGLALVVDLLAAGLSNGPIGRELDAEREKHEVAAFFLAVDPAFFGGREVFADAVKRLSDQVYATAPIDPERPVRLPGDRARAERLRRLAEGVPLDPGLWSEMAASLAEAGFDVPPLQPEGGART